MLCGNKYTPCLVYLSHSISFPTTVGINGPVVIVFLGDPSKDQSIQSAIPLHSLIEVKKLLFKNYVSIFVN